MELDRSVLVESYLAENKGRVDSIFNLLSLLKKNSADEESLKIILRELHTLKGNSRMMGVKSIETLSQSIEDVFKAFRDKKIDFTDQIFQLIYLSVDKEAKILEKISKEGLESENVTDGETNKSDEDEISRLRENLAKASVGEDFSLEKKDAVSFLNEKITSDISDIKKINVKLSDVDDIIGKFDTSILRHFKLKYFLNKILKISSEFSSSELNSILYEIQLEFSKQEESLLNLQNSLFVMRMLPINIILTALRQNMEMEVLNSEKKARIDIPPSDVVLDKNVLEAISESLLHIVRNSFSHGIETPEERRKKGKDETGLISVQVYSYSNRVVIDVSDDGQGIDFEKIRKKAINLYPDMKKTIKRMGDGELEQFLYKSGFSTKKQADEFSGRGVGLDVVKSNIDKVKGKINLKTEKDKGTTFSLSFPVSLATLHGLFIKCEDYKLFVPASYIREVEHIKKEDYLDDLLYENSEKNVKLVKIREDVIPIYALLDLIHLYDKEKTDCNNLSDVHTVVVIDYLGQKIGIRVCDVFSTATLIVQQLPSVFSCQEILQGVVFDENYSMVPILNVPKLIQVFASAYGDMLMGGGDCLKTNVMLNSFQHLHYI